MKSKGDGELQPPPDTNPDPNLDQGGETIKKHAQSSQHNLSS